MDTKHHQTLETVTYTDKPQKTGRKIKNQTALDNRKNNEYSKKQTKKPQTTERIMNKAYTQTIGLTQNYS